MKMENDTNYQNSLEKAHELQNSGIEKDLSSILNNWESNKERVDDIETMEQEIGADKYKALFEKYDYFYLKSETDENIENILIKAWFWWLLEKWDKNRIINLTKMLSVCTDRERTVLIEFFWLFGRPKSTLEDLWEKLGITRERARQVKNEGIWHMIRHFWEDGIKEWFWVNYIHELWYWGVKNNKKYR